MKRTLRFAANGFICSEQSIAEAAQWTSICRNAEMLAQHGDFWPRRSGSAGTGDHGDQYRSKSSLWRSHPQV